MFTRFTALLLLLCSVTVSLSGLFVFAGFEINRSYIVKDFCINRNKPQLHCNGKCYLIRKLRLAQEKEQKQEHQFQKIQLQQPLVFTPYIFKQYSFTAVKLHIPFTTGKPLSKVNVIFQPPRFI